MKRTFVVFAFTIALFSCKGTEDDILAPGGDITGSWVLQNERWQYFDPAGNLTKDTIVTPAYIMNAELTIFPDSSHTSSTLTVPNSGLQRYYIKNGLISFDNDWLLGEYKIRTSKSQLELTGATYHGSYRNDDIFIFRKK